MTSVDPHHHRIRLRNSLAASAWFVLGYLAIVQTGDRTASAQTPEDTKTACVAAAEEGQLLRNQGKLRDALERFRKCAHRSCPTVVASDCVRFLDDTEALLPSLVFRAREGERDLADVTVKLDGEVVTRDLDGRAVAVDPGKHEVVFETEGHSPVVKQIVVVEGEKARALAADFGKGGVVDEDRGPPVATWVLGGVGAASAIGFGYFGLTARSDHDELEASCGKTGSCTDEQIDDFWRKAVTADVLLGVSVVAFTAAGLVWSQSGGKTEPAPQSVAVGVRPNGGVLVWNRCW